MASGVPPFSGTRDSPPDVLSAATIVSSEAQLAPRPFGASQSSVMAPPSTGIFRSFPSAKNPISLPFGEKKASRPFSVFDNTVTVSSRSRRVANICLPAESLMEYAMRVPSAEIARGETPPYTASFPKSTVQRAGKAGSLFGCRDSSHAENTSAKMKPAAATAGSFQKRFVGTTARGGGSSSRAIRASPMDWRRRLRSLVKQRSRSHRHSVGTPSKFTS